MVPGSVVADRFEIERVARAGGMGTVYRALDRLTGEPVALKTSNPEAKLHVDRFLREAAVLAELRHPSIVRYVAHGNTPSGEPWLAMEWLEGEDLCERLARSSMSIDEAVLVTLRASEALAVAHQRGLVHRDIKPSNVFLQNRDPMRVKILDFGIVCTLHAVHATHSGIVIGTPGYMAPEQARGDDADPRADVFALGCVLFECITGRPLFVGRDAVAVQVKIVLEEAPAIASLRPEVTPALDRLINRMLAKNKMERPADAAEVAVALSKIDRITQEAPRSTRPSPITSLTTGEQRLLCVVIARLPTHAPASKEAAATVAIEDVTALVESVRETARAHGGRVEALADGSLVVSLEGSGGATDQAARAARCALSMRQLIADAPMGIATGRGDASMRLPMGEVIDRAARLLAAAERARDARVTQPIEIDELTAGLLDERFDVAGIGATRELRGAREAVEGTRTLLGRPTPCVGRARELGTLEAAFEECVTEGVAQAVLVVGSEGVGKSRVRYEFVRRLHQRDPEIEVFLGRGDPMSAGSPFAILSQAIRRGLGLFEGESLPLRRMKLRSRLARRLEGRELERITHFLGELLAVPFAADDDVQLQAARHDPVLMGDQMRRAFEDWLAAECADHPVVLVLEDLQWGDLPTVQFLDAALRNLPDKPLMVLALARPEVEKLFPLLWSGRVVTRVHLAELTKKASAILVRSVLGDHVDEARVANLVERAAGNAFFLEELIRASADGRDDGLPDTVLAIVQTRLEALPAEARRVLRAASVFGQNFWESGVRALLGRESDEEELTGWIAHLVDREVILRRDEARFTGHREYTFRHALLRDAAYAMLIDDDRLLGHRLAAEWLEEVGDGNAVALAEHFERGGRSDRAMTWFARAAEQALEGNEYNAVLTLAERAIACGPTPDQLGKLRLLQAEAHRWMADYAEVERFGTMAMELIARGTSDWLDAAGTVAIATGLRGAVDRLREVSEVLRDMPLDEERLALQAVNWGRATAWLLRHGIDPLARALFDRIEEVAPKLEDGKPDPSVMARIEYARANRALYDGDLGAYLALSLQAAASFEEAGMLRNLCVQRKSVAIAQLQLGLHRAAEECLRVALVEADRLDLRDNAADARDLLGVAIARQGRIDEALALLETSVRESRERGARWAEGRARTSLAGVLLQCGDATRAEREAETAAADLVRTPPLQAAALATLGRVRLARGDLEGALSATESAMALLESLGRTEEGESLVRLARVEALIASGRPEADLVLSDARDRLLERAARIRDLAHRQSFLEVVPHNARLLELARGFR